MSNISRHRIITGLSTLIAAVAISGCATTQQPQSPEQAQPSYDNAVDSPAMANTQSFEVKHQRVMHTSVEASQSGAAMFGSAYGVNEDPSPRPPNPAPCHGCP